MAHQLAVGIVATILMVLAVSPAFAAWSRTGTPVCVAPGAQYGVVTASPYVAWTDERDGVPQVYVTSISPWSGSLGAEFPVNGLRAAPSGFSQLQLVAPVSPWGGELLIAWSEDRGTGTGRDVYLQRIQDGAPAPGWPADGLRVCGAPGDQTHPRLAASPPHTIVTWDDERDGDSELYAMDVSLDGSAMPGWPADGRAVVTNPGADHGESMLQVYDWIAGSNEFILLWSNAGRILTHVMKIDGSLRTGPYWPPAGLLLSDSEHVASAPVAIAQELPARYLVAWLEDREGLPRIFAQRVRTDGFVFTPVALDVVPDTSARPSALLWDRASTSDIGYLWWQDQRADAGDLYSSHLDAPASQPWIFNTSSPQPDLVRPGMQAIAAGSRGDYWVDDRSGVPQVYTAHVWPSTPGGVPMAPTSAAQMHPFTSPFNFAYIPENPPPPVVVWTDMRNPATAPDVYAQNLGPGGPGSTDVDDRLPTRVELSNALPTPSRGAVTFTLRLPVEGEVALDIADLAGRRVRSAVRGQLPAGDHTIGWDRLDEGGRGAAPGLYWLQGRAAGESIRRRIVLLSR